MNILEEILAWKRKEVSENKALYPIKLLERSPYFTAKTKSLRHYLSREDLSGIIAEFKRQSPSKGMINEYANPAEVCLEYVQAGASALSVITDNKYFGGSNQDLVTARKNNYCPILRKDFMLDEYQLIEARSIGADVVLLIAEILTAKELKRLSALAKELQMEVLFEVHERASLDKLPPEADLVGVNNRNLKSFEVDVANSFKLAECLPNDATRVTESGIATPRIAQQLKKAGFSGLLMGERFMRETNPGKACRLFISRLKN